MRPIKFVLLGLAALILASCRTVPIENVGQTPFPIGSEKLSMAQIEQTMTLAAMDRGWVISRAAPGRLSANLNNRSHLVEVAIDFTRDGFSITYVSSANLNAGDGQIHPKYNQWVANLRKDILQAITRESMKVSG